MLEQALLNYVDDPRKPINNFMLGTIYEEKGHFAAAIGFYLRTAEYSEDKNLIYESLLRVAICLEIQGKRMCPLKGALLRAVSVSPERPEAYFLLSRIYEITKDWHLSYAWATAGERTLSTSHRPLLTDVKYPGTYGFMFEKAVTSWWIGLYHESLNLFKTLDKEYKVLPIYEESIKNNITNITNILRSKGDTSV
jgi:tetratricopeptide (TPR) repeat protein